MFLELIAIKICKIAKSGNTALLSQSSYSFVSAISGDTLQSLLELVCYYNCSDTIPEDDVAERWYSRSENIKNYSQWK